MQQNAIEKTPRCSICGKQIADDEFVSTLNHTGAYSHPPLTLCDPCLAMAEAGSYAAAHRDRHGH